MLLLLNRCFVQSFDRTAEGRNYSLFVFFRRSKNHFKTLELAQAVAGTKVLFAGSKLMANRACEFTPELFEALSGGEFDPRSLRRVLLKCPHVALL